jgi:hypothetical protein
MGQSEIVDCRTITEAVFGCKRSDVAENQKSLPDSELLKLNPGTTINRRWVVVF